MRVALAVSLAGHLPLVLVMAIGLPDWLEPERHAITAESVGVVTEAQLAALSKPQLPPGRDAANAEPETAADRAAAEAQAVADAASAAQADAADAAQADAARDDGVLLGPEGAATLAAWRIAVGDGRLDPKAHTILFNCGTPLKYPMPPVDRALKLDAIDWDGIESA